MDIKHEPLKDSLERMKKDYETRICPGRRIEFFKAHNKDGESIPYPYIIEHPPFQGDEVAVVAVYSKEEGEETSTKDQKNL